MRVAGHLATRIPSESLDDGGDSIGAGEEISMPIVLVESDVTPGVGVFSDEV
jgi:hypothetical protein